MAAPPTFSARPVAAPAASPAVPPLAATHPAHPAHPAVTAIVTTFNEEQNIGACIESLLWCDEILVVDSFSTDRTAAIAQGYPKVRFVQRTYYGSASQKNWAMDQVQNLSLIHI